MTEIAVWLRRSDEIRMLDVEQYLRGVVPAEMPALWPMAALQAQAICARTFALVARVRPRHPRRALHVCDAKHCQVWRPAMAHERTDEAIRSTAGLALTFEGQLAQAFYSARCGGRTLVAWVPEAAPWCQPVDCRCTEREMASPQRSAEQLARSHGIGLCQYGALEMALNGASWFEILHHYYTNVDITRWETLA